MTGEESGDLRRGWTTGACATAATKAAYTALLTGAFPDPVRIRLPRGQEPAFALARESLRETSATAGIIKDAGDDPDVTHQALVLSTVRRGSEGSGIRFLAGPGVGTVTQPGLPLEVGEPAINPVPRKLMRQAIEDVAESYSAPCDVEIEISIPGGEQLALKTWNPRLGIVGGLSILGTTGVVVPYSCSAWIHSIHRGIDVARAMGQEHVAGCTGSTSEATVRKLYGLPDTAMLDMGDFVGGLLKYLRRHPLPRLTVAGGFAKISKLARGHMDLHSGRSQVDFDWLAELAGKAGGDAALCSSVRNANTANEALLLATTANLPIADLIASKAAEEARKMASPDTDIEILIIDRSGELVGRSNG